MTGPDLVGEGLAELETPLPYGLMADSDATSSEDLIDMVQAKEKAKVKPNNELMISAGKR